MKSYFGRNDDFKIHSKIHWPLVDKEEQREGTVDGALKLWKPLKGNVFLG